MAKRQFKLVSKKYEIQIRDELQQWQLSDTIKFRWLNGLKGKSNLSPDKLKKRIEMFYSQFSKEKQPRFQVKATYSVNSVTRSLSYDFSNFIVDPNRPDHDAIASYQNANTFFVPQDVGFSERASKRIQRKLDVYCGRTLEFER